MFSGSSETFEVHMNSAIDLIKEVWVGATFFWKMAVISSEGMLSAFNDLHSSRLGASGELMQQILLQIHVLLEKRWKKGFKCQVICSRRHLIKYFPISWVCAENLNIYCRRFLLSLSSIIREFEENWLLSTSPKATTIPSLHAERVASGCPPSSRIMSRLPRLL